jgi:hypothetical protein
MKTTKKAKVEKVRFNMIVTPGELAAYKAAAASVTESMSVWARRILRAASVDAATFAARARGR